MQYTNAQILAAVLNKWLEPVITQMGGSRLMQIPAVAAIQNKIRSTGWVSPQWSMFAELSPIVSKVSGRIVEPLILNLISGYPDKDLPVVAHSIVDEAIKQGGMTLMDGVLTFDVADLNVLKRLLDINLPNVSVQEYCVKTEEV